MAIVILSIPSYVLADASLLGAPGEYFQLTDRWKGGQINSKSGSNLADYSRLTNTDTASHWSVESTGLDSWFRLKNRKTGGYLHIEPDNGTVQVGNVPAGFWSSQWRAEVAGGYFRLLNRWRADQAVHVERQNGYLQHGAVPQGFWSSQWSSVSMGYGTNAGQANVIGQWSNVASWPLTAIHAALTSKGKVLTYGTTAQGTQSGKVIYDVWNPKLGLGSDSHATLPNQTVTDLFCSAQVLIPDSDEILITGGDSRGLETGIVNRGVSDVNIFSDSNNSIQAQTGMNYARWYPTVTTLANGEILAQGGIDTFGQTVATPEIYNPETRIWRRLTGATSQFVYDNNGWWYPRSWVAPNGKLFGLTRGQMYEIDTSGQGSIQTLGNVSGTNKFFTSTSVMFLPGRILQIGGGEANLATSATENASAQVTEYNINGAQPQVIERPSLSYPRIWANSTVLPDGKVLVTGGSAAANTLVGVATTAEIYNPTNNTWTVGATAVEDRLYHSTALLLPDASVLVAGGGAPGPNDRAGNQVAGNLNAEIYYPPYFFDANNNKRTLDTVSTSSNQIGWNSSFRLFPKTADRIEQINLVRLGTVTHSNNMEQRLIPLSFRLAEANQLNVTAPMNANIAPPGFYMLFAVDVDGVPSQGHIVSIGNSTNDLTYFQISDRWKEKELFADQSLDLVQYGQKTQDQQSSHWFKEKVPGLTTWFRIKNRDTNEVLHIEPNNGVVSISDAPMGYWSAQWREEPYLGYVRLINRWQSNHRIHVEKQDGRAQHGIVPDGYWSAQWKLNPVY